LRRALAPVEQFLKVEASSGIVLLVAAATALVWANSPWRASYERLWHTPVGVGIGRFAFERDVRFWINDGLMTIFFFVVGLEIRREMHRGELSELRRAALPIVAAMGGMVVPASIYYAMNAGLPGARGAGIPMATDIAFAVGVFALLGKRVPPALRVLLLALAVIDDVGAILVIAFFYSSHVAASGFVVSAVGLFAIVLMKRLGVRSSWAYVPGAVVTWFGAYLSGIHPALAGVVVGMMTPVRAWFGPEKFLAHAHASVKALGERATDDEHAMLPHLDAIENARREAVSPVERVEHALHGWVAFGIMPLFAVANAGIPLAHASFSGEPTRVFLGVVLGLVVGKPLGILVFCRLAAALGVVALPRGVTWAQVLLLGTTAGIGFTMALFIAHLALAPGALLETAKLGVLSASAVASMLSFAVGRAVLSSTRASGTADTEAEAEASTAL
jgi:NhaA family Na+:H+ antiporter